MSKKPFRIEDVDIALRDVMRFFPADGEKDGQLFLRMPRGEEVTDELIDRLQSALGDGWRPGYRMQVPVGDLSWGAPPVDEVHNTLKRMEADLQKAGIPGAAEIMSLPRGWIWPGEVFVHHACRIAGESKATEIRQIKEKFGGLRVYVRGDHEFVDLARWTERQCELRCQATGQPGRVRAGDWHLCLSDEMAALHKRDPERVDRLMYPPLESAQDA